MHPAPNDYRLYIAEPKMYDPAVQQYYPEDFDIPGGNHLFSW